MLNNAPVFVLLFVVLFCFFLLPLSTLSLLNVNKTETQKKTQNISSIEMSVAAATEPLCGIPPPLGWQCDLGVLVVAVGGWGG